MFVSAIGVLVGAIVAPPMLRSRPPCGATAARTVQRAGTSAFRLDADHRGEPRYREHVALDAETADHRASNARHIRIVSKAFAGMNVGYVHLDHRKFNARDGVQDG